VLAIQRMNKLLFNVFNAGRKCIRQQQTKTETQAAIW